MTSAHSFYVNKFFCTHRTCVLTIYIYNFIKIKKKKFKEITLSFLRKDYMKMVQTRCSLFGSLILCCATILYINICRIGEINDEPRVLSVFQAMQ